MFQVPKTFRVIGAEVRRHILKSSFHGSATVRQGKVAVVSNILRSSIGPEIGLGSAEYLGYTACIIRQCIQNPKLVVKDRLERQQ